ncbi:hypothetical protein ACH5RR_017491 [Cinchona calisaya]|uniref:Cystatin domain-containing protein n=1 Tax=Cinchona calisaya TaxID=153742 RepID=A0ABD2ZIP7_9GENT
MSEAAAASASTYTIDLSEVAAICNEGDGRFKPAELEEAVEKSIQEYKDFKDNDQINSSTDGGPRQPVKKSLGVGALLCLIPIPVFPENSQVIAIGKFAVKERNENAGTDLEFVKVMVGVKWSVVAATFYMIDIRVKSATDTKIYLEKSLGVGTLLCLIPIPVFPENSQVIAIGKFAVKERNEKAGTDLEFVKVMVGVKWSVVAATFYMIDIRVKSATDTKIYFDEVDAPFKPAEVEESIKKSIKEYDDLKDNDQFNSSPAGEGESEVIPYSLFGLGTMIRLIPLPVIPTNPQVIEIAKFAVKEGNERAGTDLEFVNVVLGIKWNVFLATFYVLGIKLKRSTDGKIHLRDFALSTMGSLLKEKELCLMRT